MTHTRVLVVDSGTLIGPKVAEALQRIGDDVDVELCGLDAAVESVRRERPSVVILNLQPLEGALEVGERLAGFLQGGTLIVTSNDSNPDLILRAMRVGARDFLAQPISEADLLTVVRKGVEAAQAKPGGRALGGEILSVFSNKGGLGTSSLAVNVATSLAESGRETVLVDLELQLGDVSVFLDLDARYTIGDVAKSYDRLDAEYLRGSLTEHQLSRVWVLPDPQDPVDAEDTESISPQQIGAILKLLKTMFHYVVVDCAHTFDERNLTALDMADSILLVTAQNLPAIRNAQRTLGIFDRLGYDPSTVKLVVNRYLEDQEISRDDLERALNRNVYFTIPNDFPTMSLAINQGKPVQVTAPTSAVAGAFRRLAAKLTGAPEAEEEGSTDRGGRGFFGKLFGAR